MALGDGRVVQGMLSNEQARWAKATAQEHLAAHSLLDRYGVPRVSGGGRLDLAGRIDWLMAECRQMFEPQHEVVSRAA